MAMIVDPGSALNQAGDLAQFQREWEHQLAARQPRIPIAALGVGLAAQAQQMQQLLEHTHRVRVNHAQRLRHAAEAAMNLVEAVVDSDDVNAVSLRNGSSMGGSGR